MKIRAADERRLNADGRQTETLVGKKRSFTKRSRLGKLLNLLGRDFIFVRSRQAKASARLLQNEAGRPTKPFTKRTRTSPDTKRTGGPGVFPTRPPGSDQLLMTLIPVPVVADAVP